MICLHNMAFWTGALCLVLLASGGTAMASGWYTESGPGGQDITMMDLRWPAWPPGTYFAFWNGKLGPVGGTFYGGLVSGPPKPGSPRADKEFHPSLIWSFWGSGDYHGDVVRNTYVNPASYRVQYGGEGMCGGLSGHLPWLEPGQWYRMLMRVWTPVEDPNAARIGWWVKDISADTWRLVGTFAVPCRATCLKGNCGFVELLGAPEPPRVLDRRLSYARVGGKWVGSNGMTVKADQSHNWHASLIEGGDVGRFILSKDPGMAHNVPPGESRTVTPRQPDEPPLDKPAIADAEAFVVGKQLAVKWRIPRQSAPQLGYRIEAFAAPAAAGQAVAQASESVPHVRQRRLDASAEPQSVRLTVTDVFDRAASVVVPVRQIEPLAADAAPEGLRAGLSYEYFEASDDTAWEQLPDFSSMTPARAGLVHGLDLSVRGDRTQRYALRYRGYLRVPETGFYVLELTSCDGSRLRIGDKLIADNDGRHGPSPVRCPVPLQQGMHAFDLTFFTGDAIRGGRYSSLQLSWEGPGFKLGRLGRGDFACAAGKDTPAIELAPPAGGANLADNRLTLQPRIEACGQKMDRVQYFRGEQQLGQSKGDRALTVVLPEGPNDLWARLWYGRRSVDSDVLTVRAHNRKAEGWLFSTLGEQHLPLGIRCDEGRFDFAGEGVCFANQTVTGDFTLTARIADVPETTPENGINPDSWVGLFLKSKLDKPFSWYFGIYRTAGKGLRGSADFRDLGAVYMTARPIDGNAPWLRLVRRKNTLRTFTSPDGNSWRQATEQIERSLPKQLHAGLVFRTIPYKNKTLFHGLLDDVKLEPGRAFEGPRRLPRAEDLAVPNRIVAVIQSASKPDRLLARTRGAGLLCCDDGGKTWRSANAGLTAPDALAVRTVAVHPTDASVVLRGGGAVTDGKLVSGLWRSADGGKSWTLATREIDFDGNGPTCLFGETLAFDPHDPKVVAAGGESAGLFVSADAGRTWRPIGLRGRRITCLAFAPAKPGLLIVGTCADGELARLGLGKPVSPSRDASPGGVYYVQLGRKPNIAVHAEDETLGVTNVAFGDRAGFVHVATTRGLYTAWGAGQTFYQRRGGLPADELLIALAAQSGAGSRLLAAPFSAAPQEPVLQSQGAARTWSPLVKAARVRADDPAVGPDAGTTCILPDRANDATIYLCDRHGLFKSTDSGRTYTLIQPAPRQN